MPNPIIAYVGELFEPRQPQPHCRTLRDWSGNQIGTCYISASWRVHSYIGSHMNQIYATINGTRYTGRGFGEGMSIRLRPCKGAKR